MRTWFRKGYRIIMGSIFPIVYYFVATEPIQPMKFTPQKFIPIGIIIFFLILISILEIERYKHPGLWPYITSKWYGKIFKQEPGRLEGTTYFLIASLITIAIFSNGIAITALLFSTFGNAASAIVGIKYGKIKLFRGEKSVEGTMAFFITCLIIGIILIGSPRLMLTPANVLLGAAVATLIEVLPIPVDDNLTIPIISGMVMQIV